MSVPFNCVRPTFAILNPELTRTVSAYQTAAGATDILSHTFMRWFYRGNPVSHLADEIAAGLMRNVVHFAPIAIAEPDNYEARSELLLSASLSHSDITCYGRSGLNGGEHPIESQICAQYNTAHGAGLAVVMPALLEYFVAHGGADEIARVAEFGLRVFGVASGGTEAFRRWLVSLGMPLTFKELGIPAGDLDAMVARCMKHNGGVIHGYMDIDEAGVREIYQSVMG
jgi:alcohol dehydrogenase YqhD (iron-dependent ADH family)